MTKITRGTTPTLIIELPSGVTTSNVSALRVIITQRDLTTPIIKSLSDNPRTITADGTSRYNVLLSQNDTLRLSELEGAVQVQARLKTSSNNVVASDIISVPVIALLDTTEQI